MGTGNSQKKGTDTAKDQLAVPPIPAQQREEAPAPDCHTSPIAVAPESTRSPWSIVAIILLVLAGLYVLFQYAGQMLLHRMQQDLRDEIVRVEAEGKSPGEAQLILREQDIYEWQYNSEIIDAAFMGDSELLALLITAGAYINATDKDGDTPLYCAAKSGHVECVRLLLAAPGIDVNKSDRKGFTPLYCAAKSGHVECARLLLAAPGIDVNKAANDNWTPLCWAAGNGHVECIRLLLAAPGIDVNATDKNGWTPLWMASWKGHVECVRLLLAAPGIDVNKSDRENGWTPLYRAAGNGHIECVRLLLATPSIDVNKTARNGWTPLKKAESERHTECARLIRKAGGKK